MKISRWRSYGYLAGAVLLLLAVLYWEKPGTTRVGSALDTRLFPGFVPQQVARIELEHLLDAVALRRDGDRWTVQAVDSALGQQIRANEKDPAAVPTPDATALSADAPRIGDMLTQVEQLTVGAVASRSAAQHFKLQVNEMGIQARFYDAGNHLLAHLLVGKQGPDLLSSFVRRHDAKEVYLVGQNLAGAFPANVTQWRDRTVWAIAPDTIQRVAIERRNGSFAIDKQPDGHFVVDATTDSTPLDPDKLRDWFERWTDLRAVEFPEQVDLEKSGLPKAATRLTVQLQDGTKKTLLVGNDAPRGFPYGQLAGSTDIYLLPTAIRTAVQADWAQWQKEGTAP